MIKMSLSAKFGRWTTVGHLSPPAGRGRIALAFRMRGSLRERGGNRFENARHVAEHIAIPESKNAVIVIRKPFVANYIARVVSVLPSIDFNNKATVTADKVDRVQADRLLPNELVAVQPARPESVPESGFRIRGSSPQTPGAVSLALISRAHAETPPHPDCFAIRPLPASGARLAPRPVQ